MWYRVLTLGLWLFNSWTAHASGELDLSSWAQGDQQMSIQEPWEFHWQSLLEPAADHPTAREWLPVGQAWNDTPRADGSQRPAQGFATYKLVLKGLRPRADGYQIGMKGAGSAFRLLVYPQDEPRSYQRLDRGRLDTDQFQASRRPAIVALHPAKVQDFVVLIQVRNRDYAWGGVYFPVLVGTGESVRRNFELEGFVSVLGIGVMFGVGIYSLMMWVRRRQDKPALMLACVSLSSIMRLCSTSPFILDRLPDTLYAMILKQEFLSMNAGVMFYLAFLIFSFREGRFRLWDKILNLTNILIIVAYGFGPFALYPQLLKVTQTLVFVSSLTFLVYSYQAWRRRQSGAQLVLVGCLLIAAAVFFDIASSLSASEIFITAWAVMIFLILQSQIIGLRAAQAHQRSLALADELSVKNQEITDFNRNLERLVESKTKAIRALLDHIPQGVCTVGPDGRISQDYSAHLVDILDIKDPGRLDFNAMVLSHCKLNPDEKNQIQSAMNATLGEAALNFELNRDKLPDQLVYESDGRQKFLKVTWNVQTDDKGRVETMLITLLDISAEKTLEHEKHEQQLMLEKIKQLVDQNPQKVQQFFSTAQPLLAENLQVIETSDLQDADVRLLFVNAHTVKGAARTLHFRSLADAIHLAEDHYAWILRGGTPQRETLLHDARVALEELESYRQINRVKLNRSDDLGKIAIDRDLVLNHFQVVRQWLQHEQPTVHDLMVFLRQHSEALTRLIFEQLPTVCDAYMERASKIARDLGKTEPQLHIDVPPVPVTAAVRVILDNCMIHLLRNALDHGIEIAEERKAAKKAPAGSIWIRGSIEGNELILDVYDDGRGLALTSLRDKALKNGWLGPQSSDEEVADLIFREGMSTSHTLTAISGRGIGMSAVRRFLEEAGGSIGIILREGIPASAGYRSFFFRMKLPLHEPLATSVAA